MFNGFNQTVIGESHNAANKVCQDWSDHYVNDNYCVAVVADGHGSKKHFRSDVGSRLAVSVVLNTIKDFYADVDEFETSFMENPNKVILKIQKHIISYWNKEIALYHENNPITDEEMSNFTEEEFTSIKTESIYGTTLIAAVMGRKFSFAIQLGDGSLVVVNKRAVAEMPIVDDESCPANLTASMCNSNAIEMFNQFYTFEKTMAMFVSTDGLYTSFGSKEDFQDYHTIITGLLDDADSFKNTILNNLTKRSKHGTQDDISLSGVFDADMVVRKQQKIMERIQKNRENAEMRKAERKAKLKKQKAKMALLREKQEMEDISSLTSGINGSNNSI